MGDAKPVETPGQAALPLSEGGSGGIGPGLGTLLQGQHEQPKDPLPGGNRPQPETPLTGMSSSLRWTLLAADVVLVLLALWLALGRPGRPGWMEVLLGVVAIVLGAWLACCAVLDRRR